MVAIYMLAEFAVFTIANKSMAAITHGAPPPTWLSITFVFLPLTLAAWWMIGVLFGPRPKTDAGS